MRIERGIKVELDPTQDQMILFAMGVGTARFAYNWGLEYAEKVYAETKKHTRAYKLSKALNAVKLAQYPWMYEVSKCIPHNALLELEDAFANFFKKQNNRPTWKKRGKCKDSFTIDSDRVKFKGNCVHVASVGWVRFKEIPEITGKIVSMTISRDVDRWFASFNTKEEVPDPIQPEGAPVGIDLGVTTLITVSDGENKSEYRYPYKRDTVNIPLKRAQRRMSRKKKGSKNRNKQRIKVAKIYRRLRNKRKDYIHKTTTELARTKSIIVMENLNVKGLLKNHCVAKAIQEAALGEVRRQLVYKTRWYGSSLIFVGVFYPSSKTCSNCGYVYKDLKLGTRTWTCPECHTEHERDFCAATNILNEGLRLIKENTVSSTEINACGDRSSIDLATDQFSPSKKQEKGMDLSSVSTEGTS